MFRRLNGLQPARELTIGVDGRPVAAREGDTLAAALLAAGVEPLRRSAVSGQPRSALCLMGTCFECLVEIDGQANQRACLTPVCEGMQVRTRGGVRAVPEAPGDA